ncbi:putative glyoxalase superfamily protein PhnB [Bacillus ectoiniformans]|nr:putative glyoxalase superfamily protein PhnB [Bacillus ectoiniformans]
MISDIFPGQPYQLGSQVSVSIRIDCAEKSKEVFEKLAEGGKVSMSLKETFRSRLYGQITDQFGVERQVSTLH